MERRRTLVLRNVVTLAYFAMVLICFMVFLRPASAKNYEISGKVEIPSIKLNSDVTTTSMREHRLETPDDIVGSFSRTENNTFLFGHSSGVFKDLDKVKVGDKIIYNDIEYIVSNLGVFEKSKIVMDELLSEREVKTLVVMTCAGEDLGKGDATHRLIITAVQIP
ncbi:MAG: sortase [Candidatus Saccharibacteria bacterium]|nr:sortase [Candidatus Saccharibacteria bacterium]